MSEFSPGTIEPDPPREPELSAANAEPLPDDNELGFKVGQRWHDLVIESELKDGLPHTFLANHLGMMERVIVRAERIEDCSPWHRGAWDLLTTMTDSGTVRCIGLIEEGSWRYEMTAVPPSTTMREWMLLNKANLADLERFMRRMAAILGPLHAQGIVHLNINPDSIFVDDSGSEPIYLLGGLHELTLYTHPQVTLRKLDPYYAPPETAGGEPAQTGTRLCAWDWWSVGRVAQEFLLGRHVLSLVLDRDVSLQTPELLAKAELLLLEKEPAGLKAGAIDVMPDDPPTLPLMRGLLASSCDGRWGLDAVQRWLRHEPVQDHYDLPRTARLWSWRGRILTTAEAAELFVRAEHWNDGEMALFDADDPESFAYFLNEAPAFAADAERLRAVNALTQSGAWEAVPVPVRRTVATALAWLSLAIGAGGKATLRVRGRAVSLSGLSQLLKDGPERAVAIVQALLLPEVIQFVEGCDEPSARTLKEVTGKGGEALRQARESGWLTAGDVAGEARVLELSLQLPAALRGIVEQLQKKYASCVDVTLAAWLNEKNLSAVQLVLLAYSADAPERYGYITHEVWRRQLAEALKTKGDQLVTKVTWLRLQQLLRLAPLWGTPSTFFSGIVLVLTAVTAWIGRSFLMALVVAGALMLSRVWLWWRVRRILRHFDASAEPWLWRDEGKKRCAIELARFFVDGEKPTLAKAVTELRDVRRRLSDLATAGWHPPRVHQPYWSDLYAVMGLATAIVVAAMVYVTMHPHIREVAPPVTIAVTPVEDPNQPKPPPTPEELIATGRYEMVDDGFGRRLRGPLEKWEHFVTTEVPAAQVAARSPATAEQAAFAVVSGMLLLQPFPQKAVHAILAVRVPTTHGYGVMLYNGRDRVLAAKEVLLLDHELAPGEWRQFGRLRAIYLGQPVPLDLEFSLAPP